MNKCIICGRLGQDPELRHTQGGQAVLNLRVATSETYVDREGKKQERTDWHGAVIWAKRAEALAKILKKGDRVLLEGSLRTSSYEKNGQKHFKTEINVTDVELLGGGKRSDEQSRREAPAAGYDNAAPNFAPDVDDDDIPF